MKKLIAVLLAGITAFSLSACAGTAAAPAAEPAAETAEAASAEEAAPAAGLKVALCLSGAANDQGWNQTAYEGALKACEKYGMEMTYSENLTPAEIAEAFADYAAAGYDVIIGHGYEFGDPALEVAGTYPDVLFICTEADAAADNVASYVMACEETGYVEGVIAAMISKSGKVGAIGPLQGDSLVKIVNGFEDGAKSVDPDIVVETAWTNSFVDTQLAQEAAEAMITDGVDVIKHCANACGNGAITAAVAANIYCMGDSYDQSSFAPDNMVDSALYNLDVVLDIALGTVADGNFKGEVYNLGFAENAVGMSYTKNIPDDVRAAADELIEKIKSGEFDVVKDVTIRN
ncbi:MAG: BMP family protein [Lachnospiraceae bacterium]|nr:BMP family protein [Lachnospiraceae bacterium]